jgi:predicted transcriptional regulator
MADEQDLGTITHVVTHYVKRNQIPATQVPDLIASIAASFAALGRPSASVETPLVPAVPVKKSITDNYIVCLEDGKRFKSMKRHLTQLGMTPEEYRAKWGLPADYPMAAPAYSAHRSTLAKSLGLGRKPGATVGKKKPIKKAAKAS